MKKCLIVVDMQNDFITGSLGSKDAQAIVPNIKNKVKEYVDNKHKIIYTQDTHYSYYLETQEGKELPVEHCIKETEGWKLSKEVLPPYPYFKCIEKETFGSLSLPYQFVDEEDFEESGEFETKYDEIELCGLVSSICVVTNALILKTYFPELKITVDAKCVAGITEEDYKASLLVMKMCQINVINE